MKRLERLVATLTPNRWPIRWRLAAVSAILTFVILVVFALVVGRLTQNRLEANFNSELRDAANQTVQNIRLTQAGVPPIRGTMVAGAVARVVDRTGHLYPLAPASHTVDLGPLPQSLPGFTDSGALRVYSTRIPGVQIHAASIVHVPAFLQYGRNTENIESTISRLWLFLGLGVLGGAALAALAGIAIAGRAMRPIASLTSTARSIAATRDPSQRIPEPERHDEVGELARTLDQMLRELDAARSETEQMMQLQREFVADASHELRTPLTSVLANLELLQERLTRADAGTDEHEMVSSALRSSKRMSRLVSDLLLLARADAGRASPRAEVDLGEVATAAVAEVRPVADGHRLTILEAEPVSVQANADELHRLAVNLLDNGVRHTPDGTEIQVAVERRNGDAVLEVSDDGPGLPSGMEGQIFSRFVRGAGPADLAGQSGTGLGLAIVKAVATSHGGQVEAGTSSGGGARFTVRLPASA
ncbi:MAG TPA: HAMP domain-containing sensor histidine kinase [Solirubrobacterales bacterium]|nr:HAMP domain-containing sensor histidine kinase [Solirubrobacterales bacterium]